MEKELKKHLDILLPTLTTVIALFGLYLLAFYIFPFLSSTLYIVLGATSPFILAIIIAILIDPLVNYLEKRVRLRRSLAVLISLLTALTVVSFLVMVIFSKVIVELIQISSALPQFTYNLANEFWDLFSEARTYISNNPLPPEVNQTVQSNILAVLDWVRHVLTISTEVLLGLFASLPIGFLIIIVSAVATYFFSKDKEEIYNFVINILPAKVAMPTDRVFGTLSRALTGFVRAQIILITMTGIQTIIGLHLLGIDYALTIGILVGICDILPILGPGTILIPWGLWNIVIGNYGFGLALIGLYAILIIIRSIIEPKLLGNSIGLHPLATLIAIFVGLRLWGALGILIGPILLIVIKALFNTYGIIKET